jgi:hypothetical protein
MYALTVFAIHLSGYKNEDAITTRKPARNCYLELSTDITLNLT